MKSALIKMNLILCLLVPIAVFANQYKIIIDAGSTGSRLHLYQYQMENIHPIIQEVFTESVKPGLSSYESNPQAAGKSLKPLFDDAIQQLKDKNIPPSTVEVNILATAGMRLLPVEKQELIYANVKKFILDNQYEFSLGHIETISGKMEAVYAWLDVNYLAHHFQNHTPTVGSIDIGGASTQIAFETHDYARENDEIDMILENQHYRVFAKSFLGLGLEQARDSINLDNTAASCYPSGYQATPSLKGNFSFVQCSPLYKNLLQLHQVAEQLLPLDHQTFVAFSGAYHTYHFLDTDKTPDQSIVENRIQTICIKSWDQLKQDYPQVPEKYLGNYCAYSVYVDNLLHNTYHLKSNQLMVTTQMNNQDLDWALGAMLFSLLSV